MNTHYEYPTVAAQRFDNKYLFSRSIDILFQQSLIIISYVLLYSAGFSILFITIYSIILCFFTHLGLFLFMKKEPFTVWFLTISSTITCIIYPYLILKVPYGFVYTYILHWINGYVLLGILLNVRKK